MTQSEIEEAKLNAMQRAWQGKRGHSSFFEETAAEVEEQLFSSSIQSSRPVNAKDQFQSQIQSSQICKDNEAAIVPWDVIQEQFVLQPSVATEKKSLTLDASAVGDLPAIYTICALDPHQFPVIGVYVDKSIIPGFKYKIRLLPAVGESPTKQKCMFNGKALTLRSIGRGYARRFTFEADENHLNNNENYFYSDNRSEGYAFEWEPVSEGDKFTIFDMNNEAQGTLEVLKIEGPQFEISNVFTKHGIEKRANVKFIGKVEFYETGVAKPRPLSGVVISLKAKGKSSAEIQKVNNVAIQRQRYYLLPGIRTVHRRVTVRGEDINDVPTKYSMTGLEPYELPVVGTYIDPRVVPGFHYRVRPNDRREHLFSGRALKLVSIGMGYAKRLTFEPDSNLVQNNYLWSDNHPDGLGLEIRAVRKGMTFIIQAGEDNLGEATVWRADKPQREEKMEKVKTSNGKYAIEKYIHIDVMCHIKIAIPGASIENAGDILMSVYGLAVVRKEPNARDVRVLRVENVGLDSQLNVLFAQNRVGLTFFPKK